MNKPTTSDINKYARVGAFENDTLLAVEYFGETIFYWNKDNGSVEIGTPDGIATSENLIRHLNTAAKIAGFDVEFVRNKENQLGVQKTFGDETWIGWINLDSDNLWWEANEKYFRKDFYQSQSK